MSLLRKPTKLTDRVENESDVERREKQPTRDKKGGAMLWLVTNQPMKYARKLAYTGVFARISQLSSGHIPSLTPKPVVGISQTDLGRTSSSGHTKLA